MVTYGSFRLASSFSIVGMLFLCACGSSSGGGGATPDFILSVTPSVTIQQGSAANATVTVEPVNGFTGVVSVSFSASQNGISASSIQVAAGKSGTLNISVASTVSTTAPYSATITGINGGLSHSAALQVVVVYQNVTVSGTVQAGQQPVSDATIQLYAAGTAGYGSSATGLLNSTITSDANGNFSITGNYTCPSASVPVYLVASGGNPGMAAGTNNTALTMMAAVGPCGTLNKSTFVTIDEVTTVASVWALAQFLSVGGGANLGTSSTNTQGLANAFAAVSNLVDVKTGLAPGPNLPSGATAPTSELNTLADILSPCVKSSGTTGECSNLFAAATPAGVVAPPTTLDAALNIATHPGNNVKTLFNLVTVTPAFQPTLSSAPTDWTVALSYPVVGFAISSPVDVAIDSSGNVWVLDGACPGCGAINEFSSTGATISPSGGYIGGGLNSPVHIAIDESGNVWAVNNGPGAAGSVFSLSEFSSSGTAISSSAGYTGGGLNSPEGVALDSSGNVWVANLGGNSLSKFSAVGIPISPSSGYTGGGLNSPSGTIAIDSSGNVWVINGGNSLSEFSSAGTAISPSHGLYRRRVECPDGCRH
jgi:hypothetical protein